MANTYGRAVDVPMTNKSGGGVIAGDVVVYDSTTNDSFTTTTSAASALACGIAQDTIASNASGRIRTLGYCPLVNVAASVTRLNFGATHSVAKQAADVGAARLSGTFLRFLSSGTTPDAIVYPVDLAGAALTDPTTTRGDIIARGASALARLAMAAAGKFLSTDGTDAAYIYPPGHEFDFASNTASDPAITATSGATANTVTTGNAVTYDGATVICVDIYAPAVLVDAGHTCRLVLYDNGSLLYDTIGWIGAGSGTASGSPRIMLRFTPSNAAHTYSVRAYVSAGTTTFFRAGAAVSACDIRITKV